MTRMLRWLCLTVCVLGLGPRSWALSAEPEPVTKRYALIVAHNASVDEGVKPLQYADDDGARYHEMFQSLGDRSILLSTLDADSQRVFPDIAAQSRPPTRAQLVRAVAQVKAQLQHDRQAGHRTEVYLVFTGHGNVDAQGQGYLSLADAPLRRSDLYREVIRPLSGADFTHLIVDACHAYFMVQSRGPEGGADWKDDRSGQSRHEQWQAYLRGDETLQGPRPATLGVILSTSGTAEVHEWSKFRAGVFSHQLRSGMLGAADVNGDGLVEYLELEAFLAAANAKVTNPKAKIHVFASPPSQDRTHPLVRLSDYRSATTLRLTGPTRWHLEDARGLRYADMHLDGPRDVILLGAPAARRPYFLRQDQGEPLQATVPLSGTHVDSAMLAFAPTPLQARSSSVEEAFRTSLFATPFGPGFYTGYTAGRDHTQAQQSTGALFTSSALTPPPPPAATLRWGASYRVAQAAVEGPGLEHLVTPRLSVQFDNGWSVGPWAMVGLAQGEGVSAYRGGIGVEGGYTLTWGEFRVGPVARAGQQIFLVSQPEACPQGCADLLSSHLELNLELGMDLGAVQTFLSAGILGDWTTRVDATSSHAQMRWSPSLGLGVLF